MTDHLWPKEVAGRLADFLSEAFPGVRFRAVPLVALDVATLDLAWTDGPPLHEVDLLALEFVLRIQLDCWGTPVGPRIDRVSNRRTMSPGVEETLLKTLAADMGLAVEQLDMDQVYSLPTVLASARYRMEKGTVPEFLDLLFEATSFRLGRPVRELSNCSCTCSLCA